MALDTQCVGPWLGTEQVGSGVSWAVLGFSVGRCISQGSLKEQN